MKRWLFLWRGAVFYCISMVAAFGAGYFGLAAATGSDDQTTFWGFVSAMLCLLIAAISGILATAYSTTKRERMYWRAEWHREDTEAGGVPLGTTRAIPLVGGAHSNGEDRYRRGR